MLVIFITWKMDVVAHHAHDPPSKKKAIKNTSDLQTMSGCISSGHEFYSSARLKEYHDLQ
jgi:hypothetical protein